MSDSEEGDAISVLYIEDDERLAQLTQIYLESHGVKVSCQPGCSEAAGPLATGGFDLLLLDLMLPDGDGLVLCRALRARCDIPIIMVTARGEEVDRVLGLELGADDYVTKPFSPRELLARIRAQVRRARGNAGPRSPSGITGLVVDRGACSVCVRGRPLVLTPFEYRLLVALLDRAGRVVTREQLIEVLHSSTDEVFDRSIDVLVSRLRQKIGDDPRSPQLLRTVRGVGYLLSMEGL